MKFLFEDAYPQDFSFPDLESIKSYRGKLKYAEKYFKLIGEGTSRVVYKVDDERVLKLAKNKKGLVQNEVEITFRNVNSVTAKIFDYDDDNLWVEMELAKKMTDNKFLELNGFSLEEMYNFFLMRYYSSFDYSDYSENLVNSDLIKNLDELIETYGLSPRDVGHGSSWGVVLRDGEQTSVLVDFGMSKNVYYSYYSIR